MKLRHLFFACSGVFVMMFSLLLLVVIVFSDEEDGGSGGNLIYGGVSVSQEVLAHKPMLEKYAREYGIEEYLNVLLAIIQVESGGTLEDVMQSSESLGLPPNSLSTEESIKQGCKYFSELLAAAEAKGCDLNSVIQSYNYGGGFLDYVAGRGKKYTFELAESFARDKSGGKKVTYTNPVAVEKNGGWRYSYGNMFYVLLVSQYLTVAQFDDETVQAIMEEALKYEGWTYVYGGDSPSTSFDCSGLVQWCYGKAGITLPRTAQEQYNVTQHIPLSEAKAGDLVFFHLLDYIKNTLYILSEFSFINHNCSALPIHKLPLVSRLPRSSYTIISARLNCYKKSPSVSPMGTLLKKISYYLFR